MIDIMMRTVQIYGKELEKPYKAGEVIFKEGDQGMIMFGVLEGEVEMSLEGKFIEIIKAGEIFGVGAIVHEDHKRTSTAIAKTDCRLITMDQSHFLFAVQQTPMFALEVMRTYSERFRTLKNTFVK
jgi:CRP-like cAMP-binding protein